MKAVTLPFLNDEIGNLSKNLGWQDINKEAKEVYFNFIKENLQEIKSGNLDLDEFVKVLPHVLVEVTFEPDGADEFYVHKWINSLDGDKPSYAIRYQFFVKSPKELLSHITKIIKDIDIIDNVKMNLLPIEFFKYSITIPLTGEQVSYNDLINFKYNALAAERDEFSNRNNRLEGTGGQVLI